MRDALAKAIYNNLFDWIVARVNVSMKAQAETAHIIGVLDIYGFEIFDVRPPSPSVQRADISERQISSSSSASTMSMVRSSRCVRRRR